MKNIESGASIKSSILRGEKCAEHELLLACARTSIADELADRIYQLVRKDIDWDYLVDTAERHGVRPLLYRSLRNTRAKAVPADIMRRLRREFHRSGMLVKQQVAELHKLVDLFSTHGISVIPFKGPVLGVRAYGNPVFKRPGDLDLLVRRSDFPLARKLLIQQGYEPKIPAREEEEFLRRKKGYAFFHPQESVIDLHWTLEQPIFDNFPFSSKLDSEQIWANHATVSLAEKAIPTLSTEDLLLYLCAHGVKHSWSKLYLICDLAELIRRRPHINWRELTESTKKLRNQRILFLGLLLADELLQADLPEEVRSHIRHDANVEALARQVGEWLFAPSDPVDSFRYTLFRLKLLERTQERALYIWYRCLRKLSFQ